MSTRKKHLKGQTLEELQGFFLSIGEEKFRAEQAFNWMYRRLVTDFDEMQNLSKELRGKLKESFDLVTLDYVNSEISPSSGTKKFVFRTKEDNIIESVIIPEDNSFSDLNNDNKRKRITLCVSTQIGCPLDCKFCATGLMGYKKNLTAGEIFDQYLLASKDYNEEISNIVFMGMGEPLLNYNETIKSLLLLKETPTITLKRTTISTVGITPKIYELAEADLKVKLALSLHSCFEDIRSRIMPINLKYPLAGTIEAIKEYSKKTGTRITFEYVMLDRINDRDEDVRAIAKLCSEVSSKINVIPFNSLEHMNPQGLSAELRPTPPKRIDEFVEKLRNKNITVMVRDTQGDDIAAACGQLAVNY